MLLLIILLTIAYSIIYYYYKRSFSYWRKKNVPHMEPQIPFGDLSAPWKSINLSVEWAKHYKTFRERRLQYGGLYMFTKPIYMPVDAACVKDTLIKDFSNFHDRGFYYNERDEPMMANLFFVEGNRWKTLRQKLTPTFTSGKMKMMFETIRKCTEPLMVEIKRLASSGEVVNIKEVLANYSTDVIGSCAFGIECNSFQSTESDFRKYGRKIFDTNIIQALKIIFTFAFKELSRKLRVTVLEKEVSEFFTKMVTATYKFRKDNNVKRNDFMQLLIELREQDQDGLTMNEVIAQSFAFFTAGFDTSAATLTFCLFELAANPDIQIKLRNEIQRVFKKHQKVTYEAIKELEYMDQVVNEALRKHPVVGVLNRVCTETYTNPAGIVIDKGTPIFVSCLGLHRDPEYYPDPETFDPERFSKENAAKIIPGAFLPFGDGPRNCIGLRFGLMQVKVCLVSLLGEYEVTVNSKTKIPFELDLGFITNVRGGVWLNVKKI